MKKKVLIDVTSTVPRKNSYVSGIGKSTYWLINAINSLPQNEIPFDIELCSIGLKSLRFDFYNWRFKHHVIPVPQSLRIGHINAPCLWRNLFLSYNLFHQPAIYDYFFNKEKVVSTFHDLDIYEKTDNELIRILHEKTANKCNGIVCCSEFSKKELVRKLGIAPEKISVIYWGCDRELFRIKSKEEIDKVLMKYCIKQPFFFACSCSNPRKNIESALAAFKKFLINNPKHIFVIAWGNPRKELLEKYKYEIEHGKIVFLPFINDDDLVSLYNAASMSIYVTRKEGFGFPILESFACGTPIMTCRNSCLEEVGKDAAIYVGEDDIDQMASIMMSFERLEYDYETFRKKSNTVLASFSWEKCACEYIDFYKKMLRV